MKETLGNTTGLLSRDIKNILVAVKQFPEIEQVLLIGSRAIGNFKKGSDVDLALIGQNINFETISRLSGMLNEELPLPYFFDVIDYTHLEHNGLKKHIEQYGKVIYQKK
jgi:predicted nucleotidyltransferase